MDAMVQDHIFSYTLPPTSQPKLPIVVLLFALLLYSSNSILLELGREGADLSDRMEGFQMLINSCRSLPSIPKS